MSFYRFSQVTGRLTPSQQLSAVTPQGLTPANKVKPPSEVRTNYPDMFRFRSTFNLAKAAAQSGAPVRSASTALPTEFTATGFPKFPPGTKIGKSLVMGEFGPYSPKIRALQELMQKDPSVPVHLKLGARDLFMHRLMLALLVFNLVVLAPFSMYTLCVDPGPFKRLFLPEKK